MEDDVIQQLAEKWLPRLNAPNTMRIVQWWAQELLNTRGLYNTFGDLLIVIQHKVAQPANVFRDGDDRLNAATDCDNGLDWQK